MPIHHFALGALLAATLAGLLTACSHQTPSFTTEVLDKSTDPSLEMLRAATKPKEALVKSEAQDLLSSHSKYITLPLPPLADVVVFTTADSSNLRASFEQLPYWRTLVRSVVACRSNGELTRSYVIVKGEDPFKTIPWDADYPAHNAPANPSASGAILWLVSTVGHPEEGLYAAAIEPGAEAPTDPLRVGLLSLEANFPPDSPVSCEVKAQSPALVPDLKDLPRVPAVDESQASYRYEDVRGRPWRLTVADAGKWSLDHEVAGPGAALAAEQLFDGVLNDLVAAGNSLGQLTSILVKEEGALDREQRTAVFRFVDGSKENLTLDSKDAAYLVALHIEPSVPTTAHAPPLYQFHSAPSQATPPPVRH